MAHETPTIPPAPTPRPDLSLAQDCNPCHEWGTVVTPAGRHELCPTCQHPTNEAINPQWPGEPIGPRVRPTATLANP